MKCAAIILYHVINSSDAIGHFLRCLRQITTCSISTASLVLDLALLALCSLRAFVGVLYHPPRPQYSSDSQLDYIEGCIDDIARSHPAATIVLAGDFNQLPDDQLVERSGLTQIVKQPTRGANILDRIIIIIITLTISNAP